MSREKNNQSSQTLPAEEKSWHALSPAEVLEHLKVQEDGLTSAEVSERQAYYGFNQLQEGRRVTFLEMLWSQFNSFIVMLLIVASLVSILLGEWIDASAILAIVLLNAILGIVQERRAAEEFAALKKMGVAAYQFRKWIVGDEKVPANCRSAECRRSMRRVDLVFSDQVGGS